jgi:hypothetical protein
MEFVVKGIYMVNRKVEVLGFRIGGSQCTAISVVRKVMV